MPNLSPPAPNGGTSIVLAICAFSKWPELGIIPNHDSESVTRWFHEQVVCRYGCPSLVRSDQGTEYQGAFHEYLVMNGIKHRPVATFNPRANGLVERYNAVVK